MKIDLMRSSCQDNYGFLELQNKILQIACYIDNLCQAHDIDYCLMGGSALGAKRHGGFIPWDDDLDIFMTPENYEKFRDCFYRYADQDAYYLQEWGLTDGMVTISKVRMNGTTYIEELFQNWDMHQGIYVDIFILHSCPNYTIQQLWQCLWGKYVIMKGLAARGYCRRGGFLGFALKMIGKTPERFLVRYGLKQVYRWRNKETKYYCNFLGKAVFRNAIYKRSDFTPTEYVPFETVHMKAPVHLHEFLSDRFGDYMKIPSSDRIRWEQHAQFWDVNRDFRAYLPNADQFKDEQKLI